MRIPLCGAAAIATVFTCSAGASAAPLTAPAHARAEVAYYARALPARLHARDTGAGTTVDTNCFSTAYNKIDPQVSNGTPTNPAWIQRDALNQYCATLRLRDQFASPAYGYENNTHGGALYLNQLADQIEVGPGHLHGGVTTLIPGSLAADAFRTLDQYKHRTGATVTPVSFTSSDGAVLRGNIFMPPPGTPRLKNGHYPGVVITDGSIQAFQNLYYWAAEGLAQYGYEVMTYDVQGQGDSDLLPSQCDPTQAVGGTICQGVPYQQNYNFYQGAEDALNFFLSTPDNPSGGSFNPGYHQLDPQHVGIAGHSLGASAVSWVGQCDSRVKAIVAWDDYVPVDPAKCAANVTIPAAYRATALHTPTLTTANDYEFNVQPATSVPNPHGGTNTGGLDGDKGYLSLANAGVDSEIITIRNGTHLTYTYVPYILPANELGERQALYYTLAWFDQYLREGKNALLPESDTAYQRLTSLGTYDQSADHSLNRFPGAADISFGAGTYSVDAAAADPTNGGAGNVPYKLEGVSIPGTLSFYYYSQYHLHRPGGDLATCSDMLGGCPAQQPATP